MHDYSDYQLRRSSIRIPLTFDLMQYVRDAPAPALCVNLGTQGLYVHRQLRSARGGWSPTIGLEFQLPGTGEVIWARGDVVFDHITPAGHGMGVRFSGMASCHRDYVRDYLAECRRKTLLELLTPSRKGKQRHYRRWNDLPQWLGGH